MKYIKFCLIFLFMAFQSACGTSDPINQSPKETEQASSLTPNLIHTEEIIVTPTFTELTIDERQKVFLRGFSPPICDLPCLGNIKPGITNNELILSDLYDIGLYPAVYDTHKNLLNNTIEIENPIMETEQFSVLFEVQLSSTVIDSIYIEGSSPQDLRYFNEVWQYYEIDKVLELHGLPDQIVLWIDTSSTPAGKYRLFSGYSLFLFYEDDAFVIGYHGLAESKTSDGDFTLCPMESKTGFSIGTIVPQKRASLDNFMYRAMPDFLTKKRLDFTKSTGLSIDNFHDFVLSDSSENQCILTKR